MIHHVYFSPEEEIVVERDYLKVTGYYKLRLFVVTEAEYAGKLGKIIIPVKVNRDYDPKGWLGNIVGAKRVFEFSGKYLFERQAPELLTQIRICLKNLPPKPPKDDEIAKGNSIASL